MIYMSQNYSLFRLSKLSVLNFGFSCSYKHRARSLQQAGRQRSDLHGLMQLLTDTPRRPDAGSVTSPPAPPRAVALLVAPDAERRRVVTSPSSRQQLDARDADRHRRLYGPFARFYGLVMI